MLVINSDCESWLKRMSEDSSPDSAPRDHEFFETTGSRVSDTRQLPLTLSRFAATSHLGNHEGDNPSYLLIFTLLTGVW